MNEANCDLNIIIFVYIIIVFIIPIIFIKTKHNKEKVKTLLSNKKCKCGCTEFNDHTYVARFSGGHQNVDVKFICNKCMEEYKYSYDLISSMAGKEDITYWTFLDKLNLKEKKDLNWSA